MRFIVRAVLLSVLGFVLLALALGWVAVEVLVTTWPDVSVNLDGEAFRWTLSDADGLGWWVLGLLLALVCLVVMVPLLLLLGLALPLLLTVLLVGTGLAAAALAVALVLSPLWLLMWGLWRALRPAQPQVLASRA